MRILFDHGAPAPLIPFLTGHTVTKAKDAGWDRLVNGELLKNAEEAGFELLVTTDKNMVTQQNLKGPCHCHCRAWQFAVAHRAASCSQDSRRRECSAAGQLCGNRYSLQLDAFSSHSGAVALNCSIETFNGRRKITMSVDGAAIANRATCPKRKFSLL